MTRTGRVTEAPTPVAEALRRKGLTVAWLQVKLGISRAFANELVWGRVSLRSKQKWAPKVARVLGIPARELFPEIANEEVGAVRQEQETEEKAEGQERRTPAPLV